MSQIMKSKGITAKRIALSKGTTKNIASRSIQVKIKVAEHGSCTDASHDKCHWDKILQERLVKLYTDMIITEPVSTNNVVTFKMAFRNRPTKKAEVAWRLSDFFSHHPVLTIESLKLI